MYNNAEKKMNSNTISENKIHLEKLTPVSSADISIYETAIDEAFADADIKNIALSGAYGSGKSSIIQTYIKKHKNYKFLQISLANFEPGKDKNEYPVEEKIVNQLTQQINPRKIPQTDFKIKHLFSKWRIMWWTIIFSLLIAAICYLKFEEKITDIFKNSNQIILRLIYEKYSQEQIFTFLIFIIVLCSITIISLIVKLFGRELSVHKLKFLNAELEIFEDKDNSNHSIFDTEIQEIFYLIDREDPDAIIFEDIDRFNSPRVLERIREINIILNNRYKRKKKPVKFIYLIKDELLEAKDRVKFFDLIIPVVPVLDGSNSYDLLIAQLKINEQIYNKLDPAFLRDISLYFTDYRLLKNIINELQIYASRIDNTELDYNKLFAIITYKSLFPKDFSQLQEGQGYVFNVLARKSHLIQKEIEDADERINSLERRIKQIKDEPFNDRLELATGIYRREHFNERILLNQSASKEEALNGIIRLFNNDESIEYTTRLKVIEGKKQEIAHELTELKHKKSLLSSFPLKNLLTRENSEDYFNNITGKDYKGADKDHFEDIKQSAYYPLLKYLIRNGYIDDSYSSYMTYFYGISLSRKDRIFLRSITDQNSKGPNYKLDSPESILHQCNPYYFDQIEILNYDLLSYIIQNKKEYSDYLDQIISLMEKNNSLEFINDYINSGYDLQSLVDVINTRWHSCFNNFVHSSDQFPDNLLYRFSLATLNNADKETLNYVNVDGCLTDYISSKPTYLDIDNPRTKNIIQAFASLNVKFTTLDTEHSNRELLKGVYENSMYVLSFENICLFMQLYLPTEENYSIIHSNYTILFSNPESALYKLVRESMSVYMELYINNCEDLIDDSEAAIHEIINTENLKDSLKEQYIGLLKQNSISDISQIHNTEFKSLTLSNHTAICNAGNILDYFITNGNILNDVLVRFIEGTENPELDFKPYNQSEAAEALTALCKAFLANKDLSDAKFLKVISALPRPKEMNLNDVAENRIGLLIKIKYVEPTTEILDVIRNNFPELVSDFIETNFAEYLGFGEISKEEMLAIIESDRFTIEQKKQALKHGGEYQISIVGKAYPVEILPDIMGRYLCDEDLEDMFSHYDDYPENTRNYIFDKAHTLFVESNLDPYVSILSKHIGELLICDSTINISQRIAMLDSIADKFNSDEVRMILKRIDAVFDKVFSESRPKRIPATADNEKLLEIAQRRNAIKSYKKVNKINFYQVTI